MFWEAVASNTLVAVPSKLFRFLCYSNFDILIFWIFCQSCKIVMKVCAGSAVINVQILIPAIQNLLRTRGTRNVSPIAEWELRQHWLLTDHHPPLPRAVCSSCLLEEHPCKKLFFRPSWLEKYLWNVFLNIYLTIHIILTLIALCC